MCGFGVKGVGGDDGAVSVVGGGWKPGLDVFNDAGFWQGQGLAWYITVFPRSMSLEIKHEPNAHVLLTYTQWVLKFLAICPKILFFHTKDTHMVLSDYYRIIFYCR